MCGVKKNAIRVFIVLLLLTSLSSVVGYSWVSGYNNRIELNISTSTNNYTGVATPIILNSSVLGANPCQDSFFCNDSLATTLSDAPLYFYNEYYNASDNWRLFVNISYLNTSVNSIYFYYNSSTLPRSAYYNGNKVFLRFNDFENYSTNGTRVSADFGTRGNYDYPIIITGCYKDGNCISVNSGTTDGIVYGFMTRTYDKGILEYYYRITANPVSDATFYVSDGLNGTEGTGIGSVGSITLQTAWTKVKYVWNGAVSNVSFNGGTPASISLSSNASQIVFPFHLADKMPFYHDNFFVRQLIEEPITLAIGNIENAPSGGTNNTVILNFPANNSLNTTNTSISFGYTPTVYSGNLLNCSLYTNKTGSWGITQTTGPATSSFCYQESANVSTACGGLATGKYGFEYTWDNQNNLHDGDWNTGAVDINTTHYSYFYINYTKPASALPSSKWQVKTNGTFENVSVGLSCWNFGGPLLRLMIYSTFGNYHHITCETLYSGYWYELLINPGPIIYEEAMWWNLTSVNNSLNTFFTNFSTPGNYSWGIACWNETNQTLSETRVLTIVPPISNTTITTNSSGFGFRSDTLTNTTFVNPSPLPILCNYTINGIMVDSMVNATGSNSSSYNFNLSDGLNNFSSTCWDTENHTMTQNSSQYAYAKHFILVVEDTGANFTTADFANKTIRAISENSSAIFQFNNDTANVSSIYYLWTTPDYIRIEKTYTAYPNDLLYMELNLGLIDTESKVCVANTQQFYETIFYSNSKQPVVLVNNLAKCYVLASYTRHIYADALMAKAYTIKALYYLYTFTGSSKMYLSSMDGSTALAVNIDVLQFITRLHTYKLTTDEVSVGKYDNHTFAIYYFNQKQDNTQIDIEILNGSTSIFSYSDTTSPNNFTIYFDFSAYDLSHSVLKLIYTKHTPTGTETREILLTEMAGTGLLPASVAFMIAGVLMFFSLTLTASKHTFGYFGIFSTILAAIITTLTIATPEIRLMQAALVIILIFQIMVMRQEYAGVM